MELILQIKYSIFYVMLFFIFIMNFKNKMIK